MEQFEFTDHIVTIKDYLDVYLKNKPPDCILYSKDGGEFKIHKEIFSQTNFLREILSSAKEHCCGTLEIICPCSKKELGHLVDFLYNGEIQCENEMDSIEIQENLSKIFGFPKILSLNNPNQADVTISEESFELFPMENDTQTATITEETFESIPEQSNMDATNAPETLDNSNAVSYTHLTLPTILLV